jgi:EpsI family protein
MKVAAPSQRLLLVACVMAATATYLRAVTTPDVVPSADRLSALPLTLGEWRGRDDGRLDGETEAVLQADAYLLRTYWRGPTAVSLFVAYYGTQRSGHTIHSPLNCLPGTGWEWTERARQRVAIDPPGGIGEIEINRNIARRHDHQALVHYWYQSRGRVIASDFHNKFLLVYDALKLRRSDGALVRITAPLPPGHPRSPDDISSFIRALYPSLTQHLPES